MVKFVLSVLNEKKWNSEREALNGIYR